MKIIQGKKTFRKSALIGDVKEVNKGYEEGYDVNVKKRDEDVQNGQVGKKSHKTAI